jgi:hypothetical protein
MTERRHVSGPNTSAPVVDPGLCGCAAVRYIMIIIMIIMMLVWGLAPGDDPEACLHLELVILGCGKRQGIKRKKRGFTVVVHACFNNDSSNRTIRVTISANRYRRQVTQVQPEG